MNKEQRVKANPHRTKAQNVLKASTSNEMILSVSRSIGACAHFGYFVSVDLFQTHRKIKHKTFYFLVSFEHVLPLAYFMPNFQHSAGVAYLSIRISMVMDEVVVVGSSATNSYGGAAI